TNLNWTASLPDIPSQHDGWGFYLVNKPEFLVQQNEWAYDDASGDVILFSSGAPSGIEVTTKDKGIYVASCSYLKFEGLVFEHFTNAGLDIYDCDHITVDNCDFRDMCYGLKGTTST